MSSPSDRVVVWQGDNGRFHWHYQAAGNHAIMADSGQGQGYATERDAIAGAHRVTHCALVDPDHPDVGGPGWVLPLVVLKRGGKP